MVDYSNNARKDLPIYRDIAWNLANAISDSKFTRRILVCSTSIGMAIVANKVPCIRAAQCYDTYSAERARKSDNAQAMASSTRVVRPELAKSIVNAWLAPEFEGD